MTLDEDALVCDLAETYHIYDLYQYPCSLIATLAAGLRDDSRIKTKQSGLRISPELFALSVCADKLSTLVWFRTEDGHRGVNRPASVLGLLRGEEAAENRPTRVFASGEDFEREWARLTGKEEEANAGSG